ncbi:type IV pilus secretin PilQ [Pseudomonas chengduensis]|jgi:type IV pilus assembly protein PilQ|uniref:Type IV pilus assembly protein PilQ n=1 Tax=Ectopseudomonas chengduensis TaxID=489632 RepID=A0A1G6JJX1_9GAMM|nr:MULTISPECIES: type IV pilus secretin PilQ [Pseudomonas]KQO44398.1 fimbrial protein [Pseudomonas sp. Leaf83]MDH0956875.1 type IV pilus secretin PilQ [Pseudomonas chengduensis]MDH1534648.1 type IV pilus secretin PilQ [Pseudomonas chengduensis]NNB72689.1 type IV pilus secretin PilQ [Pseudomonas chengduensis]SDC19014.1 type IV pilus assembly protein PilQ [Pseudomonas chengduensis]
MNSSLSRLSVALLAALLSPAVLAANLQDLNVASLPGDRVELKLSFDEPVTAPRGYTIEQPARIALDLPGVSNKLGSKNRELGVGNARSVTIVEAKDRTRLIVNLTSLAPYSTRVEGNDLYVLVGDSSAVASRPSASAPVSVAAVPPKKTYGPQAKAISNIDFQRGEQGEGNIVITLSDASVSPDIQEQGGKIRLDFAKTELPESLRVRLDVKDFATPVQFVSATGSAEKTSIVIEPVGLYDYLAYQTENKLTLSVKPLSQDDVERRNAERFAYTGEKLSLNFQDIDVRSVLQLIADFTDLNLVASDTVAGNITLRLQNVPWDQALDLVLKTKGLDKRQIGNVLLVAPADEIAARERQELESQKQIAELAPLRRELIQVNYAKATDMAKLFQSVTSADGTPDSRGSITVDDRTNSIIAYQTQERLDELRRIVAQLDIPVRQVMIEARIVEANVDYDKALGVRWGGSVRNGRWDVSGKDGAQIFDEDTGQRKFLGTDTIGNTTVDDGLANLPFVDMGVQNSTSGIAIGYLGSNIVLDLQLSAMEKTGNGEIVSQPKVVTSDKETAKILKGQEVPYQEASSSGATTTSFKEAALALEVTPQITPDNRIIMEVKVTKDAPDFANLVNGVPPLNKNEVNAKVLVNDGETIVIGGVFSNTQTSAVEKVPFLGDLPFLGRVFRRDIIRDNKAELLVFITPRIMNNQAIAVNR